MTLCEIEFIEIVIHESCGQPAAPFNAAQRYKCFMEYVPHSLSTSSKPYGCYQLQHMQNKGMFKC